MSMMLEELQSELRAIAPRELEEEWDNGGMQINMGKDTVNKVLVCLEITKEVVEEAKGLKADFILTHHPLLFKPIDVVDGTTTYGEYIIQLIKNDISVYSAHTSFDAAFGGNNDYLADRLGLNQVRRLKLQQPLGEVEVFGRIGVLQESISLQELGQRVEQTLKMKAPPRMVGNPEHSVRIVGLCSGGGAGSIFAAIRNGCDVFITGDIDHHQAQAAREMGICLIDAGHYATERIFAENFAKRLRKAVAGKVEVLESQINTDPFDPETWNQ
ncbi:MAG: Nif3-like dinuclear metal center hexameric protein [Bacillota bacterium]|nr:Nif3-like dinuclear metal center hexameric protein [Bacillota bacterium]